MKYALITGASTGIGKATAIEFARHGYFVFLIGRNKDKLSQTQNIIDGGGRSQIVVCDLSNIESINYLINVIRKATTQLHAIINIAGIWHGQDEVYADKKFVEFDQRIITETFAVGISAPTLIVHGLLPLMPAKSKIINLSGTFENGAKGWLPYFVSKRAIEDLTIGLSQELIEDDIQVNCVSPSDTATENYAKYFPQYINDAIEPEKVAETILLLCSSKYEDVTGKVFVIKKGQDLLEGFHC